MTENYGLVYTERKCNNDIVVGYCDADWAGDVHDRRSVSGYCLLLYGSIVSWCTQKQKTVSLSTAEAEYMALSLISCEGIWFKGLVNNLGIKCDNIIVFEDNQSCIHLAKNRENSKRVKHIDIKHHFIRNLVEEKTIVLQYIRSSEQLSDIFTKSLPKPIFNYFRTCLGVDKCWNLL